MANRIHKISVAALTVSPAEAKLRLLVTPERPAAQLAVVGRVVGPHSAYASTIEVAYPMRGPPPERGPSGGLMAHGTVPEPNLWGPAQAFLYQVFLDLTERGRPLDSATLWLGFRTVELGPRGLWVNGQAFVIHGVSTSGASAAEVSAHRNRGYNTLLPESLEAALELGPIADRLGMFVLPVLHDLPDVDSWEALRSRPSYLGAVLACQAWPTAAHARTGPQTDLGPGVHAKEGAGAATLARFRVSDASDLGRMSPTLPTIVRIPGVIEGQGADVSPHTPVIGYWTDEPATAQGGAGDARS